MPPLDEFSSLLTNNLPWLPSFWSSYKIEILLTFSFFLLLVLILSFLNQRSRYRRLKKWVIKTTKMIKSQESLVQELEKKVEKIKKSQEGVDYWSNIRGELGELSKLPSLEEQGEELILRTHLSKLKKDDVDVTATPEKIRIGIYSDKIPLKCSYSLPSKIDPHKLTITYKGNTLEIRAKKSNL